MEYSTQRLGQYSVIKGHKSETVISLMFLETGLIYFTQPPLSK
jgi:hypothetical protein